LPNNYQKTICLISLSVIADKILFKNKNKKLFNMAMNALHSAKTIAISIHNENLLSYIFGYMGKLNETNFNYSLAIKDTKVAINLSQQNNIPESLYLWQWQLGRLLLKHEKSERGISKMKQAISTLSPKRFQIYKTSRNKKQNFQQRIKNVYLSLIEQQWKQLNNGSDNQYVLLEIRQTMDQLKQAQLENFYKDECIVQKDKAFKDFEIHENSAVIYPIVLSDRLITLLFSNNQIKSFVSPYNYDLKRLVKNFGHRLRDDDLNNRFLIYARKLYDILIKPLEKELIEKNIDTLVFSPDGILNILPFSALHDGTQFLVEKYAIAIIPAIHLTDLTRGTHMNKQILLAGLSKEANPPLPYVQKELHDLKSLTGDATLLLDQNCTRANIEFELHYNDYSSIVFATHGHFGHSSEKSFISIYQDDLTLDNLKSLLDVYRFRNQQLDLLTLSACETAKGDEQVAMGLAGIALKTGVKSVLATLWSVHDEVAHKVIKNFFEQWILSGISKAKAMQEIKKKLISSDELNHPYFWCPYLLIGNWY